MTPRDGDAGVSVATALTAAKELVRRVEAGSLQFLCPNTFSLYSSPKQALNYAALLLSPQMQGMFPQPEAALKRGSLQLVRPSLKTASLFALSPNSTASSAGCAGCVARQPAVGRAGG